MRKFCTLIISTMIALTFLLNGCATNKMAVDLVNYVNQGVLNIADLERISLEKYASVVGENYTTDKKVLDMLKEEVVPIYGRFLDGLREITPQENEVKMLHGIYIRGAESLYEGFKMKVLGIERNDEGIIRMANEKIEKGAAENQKWRSEIMAMYEKHGVADEKELEKAESSKE